MKELRCIINISALGLLSFYVGTMKVTGQSVITADIDSIYNASNIKVYNDHCKCINYNCGCCQYMKWDEISLNGTLCANASYLEYDYGISVTLTFNKLTIINETVSARNPPPICIGENIVNLEIEVCLHIYDINIEFNKFHACFEVFGRIMKIKLKKIQLGCIDTKHKEISYIEYNITDQSSDFKPLPRKEQLIIEPAINSGAILTGNKIVLNLILLPLFLYSCALLNILVIYI